MTKLVALSGSALDFSSETTRPRKHEGRCGSFTSPRPVSPSVKWGNDSVWR